MNTLKLIRQELIKHSPFTAAGAISGIIVMAVITLTNAPRELSNTIFYTLHPMHVVLSALVTTAIYRLHYRSKFWIAIILGYTGSVGIATLSDALIPYLGGNLLGIAMEFHVPFLETTKMPVIGIAKWQVVNGAAIAGILLGYFYPKTKLPHTGHVLLSTWASLFHFTAFGTANWINIALPVFTFLFLAVWIPCCVSDIVYPLLWPRKRITIEGPAKDETVSNTHHNA